MNGNRAGDYNSLKLVASKVPRINAAQVKQSPLYSPDSDETLKYMHKPISLESVRAISLESVST